MVRAAKFIFVSLIAGAGMLPCSALMGGWQQRKAPASSAVQTPGTSTPGINPAAGGAAQPGTPKTGGFQLHLNGPGPHRGDWLRKYGTLPATQQEQQLKEDPSFRGLAPDQQQKLLNRLRNFNSLTPDGKAKVLNRMETFEHLSPAQQQAAKGLFQRYRALPDDRRSKVSQAYHQLSALPPDQRSQLLSSDEYRNNFSDDERELLRGMSDLNLPNRND